MDWSGVGEWWPLIAPTAGGTIWIVVKGVVRLTRWAARRIAAEIVGSIGEQLQIDELRADVAYIKDEVTLNGGTSLKDLVHTLQRQVEALHTDR